MMASKCILLLKICGLANIKGIFFCKVMKLNKEFFLKAKDYYIKHKLYIGLGLISVLLFVCPFVSKMWIAVAVVMALFLATCTVQEIFVTMLFMMPFSGLDSIYVITIILAMIVLVIKYVIDVIKKNKQVFWFPLGVTLAIIAISSLKSIIFRNNNIETGMLLIFVFALIYFVYVYHNEISISKCFNGLFAGLAVAVLISLFLGIFFNDKFKYYIWAFDGVYKRLKMTTFHMNNLALLCIFEMAFSVHSLLNGTRNPWIDVFAIIFTMILGVLTLSKAFLAMIALFVCYFVFVMIMKSGKKAKKFVIWFAIVVLILCLIGHSYIDHIFDRLFLYNNGDNFFNEILNGRVDIWKQYLNDYKSSWHNVLFGVGLFRRNFDFDPHNVYIFVLHRFGIIGIIALGVLVYAYIKDSGTKLHLTYFNCVMLLAWFVIGLEEVVLSDQFAIFLLFGLMLLKFTKYQEKQMERDKRIKYKRKQKQKALKNARK